MTWQATACGRFARALHRGNVFQTELAARDPQKFERAARRWLQRFVDERSPSQLALAAAALSDMPHGRRGGGAEAPRALLRSASGPKG
jgi:hypothetical protein